jgi:hypothetical protein
VRSAPVGGVAQDAVPVGVERELLELGRRVSGGVQPADDRAHAGTGHAVDRHVQFLEHLQHADVRQPERAAAGEHQADARPYSRLLGRDKRRTANGDRERDQRR